jgi:hypothetical protein
MERGRCRRAPSLVRALTTHRPEMAVENVRLPPKFTDEVLRAAIEARAAVPGLPLLVLSQYVEQLYARELLADRSGGVGYLLKDRVSNVGQFPRRETIRFLTDLCRFPPHVINDSGV